MGRLYLVLTLSVVFAAPAAAQSIPIHGDLNGKTSYKADLSDAPWNSEQFQWFDQSNACPSADDMCHTHFDTKHPVKGELAAGNYLIPFRVIFRNVDASKGRILNIGSTDQVSNPIWDDTGTDTPPVLRATGTDPTAPTVVTYTGHFIINPAVRTLASRPGFSPLHGWSAIFYTLNFQDSDGRTFTIEKDLPFWANMDPTQPIMGGGSPMWSAKFKVVDAQGGETIAPWNIDTTNWSVLDVDPIDGASITGPFDVETELYDYSNVSVAPQHTAFSCLWGFDIHHHVPGKSLPLALFFDEGPFGGVENGHYRCHVDPAAQLMPIGATKLGTFIDVTRDDGTFGARFVSANDITVISTNTPMQTGPSCGTRIGPTQTIGKGGVAAVSYTTRNATAATLSDGTNTIPVPLGGWSSGGLSGGLGNSWGVNPTDTTLYTLSVVNPNGSAQCATSLVVDGSVVVPPPPPEPPPLPPPPPPLPPSTQKTCTGTLTGTSVDGGVTVTETGISWMCS